MFRGVRASTGSSANAWQFTGEQHDEDSGLYYLRARHYDPATGRFLGQDPIGGSLPSPRTQNPYAYSLNNPVNYIDPSGQMSVLSFLLSLRPAYSCVGLDIGCIGAFISAMDAYNDFVLPLMRNPDTWITLGKVAGEAGMLACRLAFAPGGGVVAAGFCAAGIALYVVSNYDDAAFRADSNCERGVIGVTAIGGLLPVGYRARVVIAVSDGTLDALFCPGIAHASEAGLSGSSGDGGVSGQGGKE